jgi:chromosome partitioning protein
MLISDLALIPVVPSPADIWAAESAKKLAESAQASNEDLAARVVANMVQRSTSLAKDLMSLLEADQDFPLMRSALGSRTAFRDAQLLGATVHQVPRASAAVAEVEAMANEVLGLVELPLRKKSVRK